MCTGTLGRVTLSVAAFCCVQETRRHARYVEGIETSNTLPIRLGAACVPVRIRQRSAYLVGPSRESILFLLHPITGASSIQLPSNSVHSERMSQRAVMAAGCERRCSVLQRTGGRAPKQASRRRQTLGSLRTLGPARASLSRAPTPQLPPPGRTPWRSGRVLLLWRLALAPRLALLRRRGTPDRGPGWRPSQRPSPAQPLAP